MDQPSPSGRRLSRRLAVGFVVRRPEFSPDGSWLAPTAKGEDEDVVFTELASRQERRLPHAGAVFTFSADGRTLVTVREQTARPPWPDKLLGKLTGKAPASYTHELVLFDTATGERRGAFQDCETAILSPTAARSSRGTGMASSGSGTCRPASRSASCWAALLWPGSASE
jgi:hypothetical protein